MDQCRKKNWQYMIVLKDDSLPTVWEEFNSLLTLTPENNFQQVWGKRRQTVQWANNIDYYFGANGRNNIKVHVVICDEEWERVNEKGEIVTERSRHAWISNRPLNHKNPHERRNLATRHR